MNSILYLVGVAVVGLVGNYVTAEREGGFAHVERQNAFALFMRAFRLISRGRDGG